MGEEYLLIELYGIEIVILILASYLFSLLLIELYGIEICSLRSLYCFAMPF